MSVYSEEIMHFFLLIEDCSAQQSASLSPPTEQCGKDELEVEKEGKVFFLRNRVTAAPVETDSEDNNDGAGVDEEHVRHLLSEGFLDEDLDETDEDSEAFKSVERKCPYCPDRFHNGIGLANHVRGHLNRVGVSYNVRHFISPEEVNAIEKKYSYQKKKKKGQWHAVFISQGCVEILKARQSVYDVFVLTHARHNDPAMSHLFFTCFVINLSSY